MPTIGKLGVFGLALIKIISAPEYSFNNPIAIFPDSQGQLWITNFTGNSVTEMDNDGNYIQNIVDSLYHIYTPIGIASDANNNLWVLNHVSNMLTEITPNGDLIKNVGYLTYLNNPSSISRDTAGHLWITNFNGNSITLIP